MNASFLLRCIEHGANASRTSGRDRGRADDADVARYRVRPQLDERPGVRRGGVVLADGLEYDGQVYASLSAVAKAITGSHTNGFLFFRLLGKGDSP